MLRRALIIHADDSLTTMQTCAEELDAEVARIASAYTGLKDEFLPFKDWFFVDELILPEDKSYRAAWRFVEGAIEYDMPHAREIHKHKLRREREPKLASLDVEYQKADETGDNQKKQQIAAQKQALRDITKDPRIEAAQTIDELKLVVI